MLIMGKYRRVKMMASQPSESGMDNGLSRPVEASNGQYWRTKKASVAAGAYELTVKVLGKPRALWYDFCPVM
jgi:hypothetical protein